MPARWASSQRPLLVRTVWVDGARHAILSADDPAAHGTPAARCCRSAPGGGGRRLLRVSFLLGPEPPQGPAPPPLHPHGARGHPRRRWPPASRRPRCCGRPFVPLRPPPSPSSSDCGGGGSATVSDDEEAAVAIESPAAEQLAGPLSERVLRWLHLAGRDAPAPPSPPQQPPPLPPPLPASPRPLRTPRRVVRTVSLEASPPSPPPPPSPPSSPLPSPPPSPEPEQKAGQSRPQLHVFVPALPRDCDTLSCHSDS
ncbi:uncharacterized protein LOC126335989 [Schistocerca gregaria]|uniref:uncharacterized protein LOC126335989 n=1 Tax=Schistocerca gregaria TaxID=7010 RepID=UPI00211DCA22|nr:uncharacterized protein LOC126335989 [Schistocerca gregaria]